MWSTLRASFRLISSGVGLEWRLPFTLDEHHVRRSALIVTLYCFEEIINGREYRIEVSAVSTDRWRAQLVRVPGGSCALMPFYGSTPHGAAQQLTDWLGRAHRAACKAS